MRQDNYANRTQKFLTPWTLGLCLFGLIINLVLAKIVNVFQLPLFFDTFGTILAGALGGIVPGVAVGFLSNALRTFSDPVSLYYGIVSIVIGALATVFSEKGYFKSIKGWICATASFVAVAGIAGVSVTWLIYGASIGGTSASVGNALVSFGITPYLAQLLADLTLELPDKLLMTGAVCLFVKYCPPKCMERFPLGSLYLEEKDQPDALKVKKSISKRLTYIVMGAVVFSCVFSIAVSLLYYMQRMKSSCEDIAVVVSKQAAGYINGDLVSTFLAEGDSNFEYTATEENLKVLYENSDTIKYLFVYSVFEDGVHVVFDLDTPEMEGDEAGTVLTGEQGLSSSFSDYLQGEEIPAMYSNGEYGRILTVYTRIYDSTGKVVAYAGVDIDMSSYYNEFAIFAIQVMSIVFAMAILMFTIVLWYVNKHITRPIQIIVHQTEQLKNISPEKWLDSEEWKNQITLHTEDELARLNDTVNQLEKSASINMKRMIETEQKLIETKKLEEINAKLEVTAQKAEEANRAKTDFLSRMSHDMRTPLNSILNFSSFIKDADSLKDAQNYGEKIKASGRYLETLINDTLGMSRIESGNVVLKPEPYDYEAFEAAIKNVLEGKAAAKGVELKIICENRNGKAILVDSLRLQQICINIMNNAIKFTPRGGIVLLQIQRIEENELEETLQFKVIDTGIGMSREFLEEKLFLPFSQENPGKDNEETGTGLGLSIARQLVELMGGTITCESERGEGTTFTMEFHFPFVERANEDVKKQEIDLGKLNGACMLLCEDHYLNREIATKLLKDKGCTIEAAEDGEKGLEKFVQNPSRYDVILMDIRMPVLDGLEATRRIRNLNVPEAKTIPIIAMTANAYEDDIRECMNAGMNAHIAKPIEPGVLYETLVRQMKNFTKI